MLEAPEAHGGHHHRTGHSRIDLIIGLLAVLMSAVSIFIAVHHGRVMEQLVEANSWPNISYSTDNEADDHTPAIEFSVRNTGVGPARIDSFEVFYNGKPIGSPRDFMLACCGHGSYKVTFATVLDSVIPAREKVVVLSVPREGNPPGALETLNEARYGVRVRTCYCSVFEECWVDDSDARRPEHVDECRPSQPVEFRD